MVCVGLSPDVVRWFVLLVSLPRRLNGCVGQALSMVRGFVSVSRPWWLY